MIETPLNKVLNTMRQYVENIYEHDSEPMLNWKDIKLVLDEIERLNNIINELEKYLKEKQALCGINQQNFSWGIAGDCLDKLQELGWNK